MLRIKLFFWFLHLCLLFPMDIRENWSDMKTRYRITTDPEIQKLLKQLEDEL